jgi:bacterioferritin
LEARLYICICNAVTERQVKECARSGKDYVSRELPEDILETEEEHIDWLETQLDLMGKEGLQNWLQSQAGSLS